jgi:hypothetical protein
MANNMNTETHARRLQAMEREEKALELKKAGATYAEIGRRLGIQRSGARKAVLRALERTKERIGAGADALRQLESSRLDDLMLACWRDALRGDVAKIKVVLSIMERRARYFGLDSPAGLQIGGDPNNPVRIEEVNSAKEMLLTRLQAMQDAVKAANGATDDGKTEGE